MKALAILAALVTMAGCTSILGDFTVEQLPVVGNGGHCSTDDECRNGFDPRAVCIEDEDAGGRICRVYLEAGADADAGADQ